MSAETMRTGSVCPEETRDPRVVLVRDKYFSLRPKPLERWLWQQALPQAAERVFWLHWEEGQMAGDWCSQIPLKRVASLCCIDPSTVTRAYQVLKSLGLIQREDPGRDPANPFQQATAVTEVRVPRDLLQEMSRCPDRRRAPSRTPLPEASPVPRSVPQPAAEVASSSPSACPTRQDAQAMWHRASTEEKAQFFRASRSGVRRIEFDAETRLTPGDRGQILAQLEQMARARITHPPAVKSVQQPGYAAPRKLSILELARTRRKIAAAVPAQESAETLRQVIWAVEEGALRRFELPLALNIALKKLREGCWTRPNRMPPNWLRAATETCSAA
ncbi:MAG: hypothetical protein ABSE43_06055 [Steroidobacteraceae bacterium]|jgi:hypothetical protein